MIYRRDFMLSAPLNSITSTQNPKVKAILRLKDKRERDETGLYLIEGFRELFRAHEGKASIESLFVWSELFLKDNEYNLIHSFKEQGVAVYHCSQNVFEKISYRDRPDGLLAIARQNPQKLEDLSLDHKAAFLVIAVSIEKPGNLGTILRSADAVGADAIIVVDQVTDIYNPNVVRASVGTLFTQPVMEASSEEVFDWLAKNQVQIVTTSPSAKKIYTQVDYRIPTAIVVGSEQYGLPSQWFDKAQQNVYIPMCGHADSLNAATCTTLMLYEVLRQRRSL